jgi:hypothetical protein
MLVLQNRLKYNKVVLPSCLGPFPVLAITDHVCGRLVGQQGVPVILQDGERFAVLAPPNKELRVVCAGGVSHPVCHCSMTANVKKSVHSPSIGTRGGVVPNEAYMGRGSLVTPLMN